MKCGYCSNNVMGDHRFCSKCGRSQQMTPYENAKVLTLELFNKIKKVGIRTGSRIFCSRENTSTDLDIILLHERDHESGLLEELEEYWHYDSTDYDEEQDQLFYSCYCYSPMGMLLNLIICKTENAYNSRVYSTRMLVSLKRKSKSFREALDDKSFRVAQYRLFRDHYLGHLPKFEEKYLDEDGDKDINCEIDDVPY